MTCPTTHERPVVRDPRTGLLHQHPAYSGWAPGRAINPLWWVGGSFVAGFIAIILGA